MINFIHNIYIDIYIKRISYKSFNLVSLASVVGNSPENAIGRNETAFTRK